MPHSTKDAPDLLVTYVDIHMCYDWLTEPM